MVEGAHEFFAGGLLVHNCVWAITDLLLTDMKGWGLYEVTRRRAAGESLEQIAGTVAPPATKDDPAPTAPRESLLEVYKRRMAEIAAEQAAKKA